MTGTDNPPLEIGVISDKLQLPHDLCGRMAWENAAVHHGCHRARKGILRVPPDSMVGMQVVPSVPTYWG